MIIMIIHTKCVSPRNNRLSLHWIRIGGGGGGQDPDHSQHAQVVHDVRVGGHVFVACSLYTMVEPRDKKHKCPNGQVY